MLVYDAVPTVCKGTYEDFRDIAECNNGFALNGLYEVCVTTDIWTDSEVDCETLTKIANCFKKEVSGRCSEEAGEFEHDVFVLNMAVEGKTERSCKKLDEVLQNVVSYYQEEKGIDIPP